MSLAVVAPFFGEISTGPTAASTDFYFGFTGPANFGSTGASFANSGSGDEVGIIDFFGDLAVPAGYVSGNPLSDTSTYDNQTIASFGAIPGKYVWTWGSGANADSFTLVIGVPEPSSLLLLPLGLAGVLTLRHRRRA